MNRILLLLIFIFWGTFLYSQNIVVDGVTFSADGKTLIKYPKDKADEGYVVPEGTEIVGKEAFMYAMYLKNLTLPLSLREIDEWAFGYSGIQMINWNTFPEKIVGEYIFGYEKSKVVAFNVLGDSDSNCMSTDGVLFSKDGKKLLCFPPKKIDDRFSGRYEVPEGVEVIGNNAFSGAELAEVVLPFSLVRIEDRAFFVSWISMVGSSTTIRTLNEIYCHSAIPPIVNGNAFFNERDINLNVPKESFDAYRNSVFWKDFRLINGVSGIVQNQISPSVSKVYIEKGMLHLESEKKVEKVDIYNTNGACIWSEYVGNDTWQLETFKLPMDLLLIKVITVDGAQEVFKLLN